MRTTTHTSARDWRQQSACLQATAAWAEGGVGTHQLAGAGCPRPPAPPCACLGPPAPQISAQQLAGMARLVDDAMQWEARNKYGKHRPSGWVTAAEAAAWQLGSHSAHSPALQPTPRELASPDGGSSPRAAARAVGPALDGRGAAAGQLRAGSPALVPTARMAMGAPVTWRQVWRYAIRSVMDDVRRRTKQPLEVARKSSGECRRASVADDARRQQLVHLGHMAVAWWPAEPAANAPPPCRAGGTSS